MFGVLGEDKSDTETLAELIKKIKNNRGLTIRQQPCSGCGELFRKGVDKIKLLHDAFGCKKIIICYDSDGESAEERRARIVRDLIRKSGVQATYCALVPVQEIESWFLADLNAVHSVFSGYRPRNIPHSPEMQPSPKEYIEKITLAANSRPRYNHATHNHNIAKYLDLSKVENKCPSFRPLADFVRHGISNVP